MITYVVLFEESGLIAGTHFVYHFYKKEIGNKLTNLDEIVGSLEAWIKDLQADSFILLKSKTEVTLKQDEIFKGRVPETLTIEELFLNSVGRVYGVFFDLEQEYIRITKWERQSYGKK